VFAGVPAASSMFADPRVLLVFTLILLLVFHNFVNVEPPTRKVAPERKEGIPAVGAPVTPTGTPLGSPLDEAKKRLQSSSEKKKLAEKEVFNFLHTQPWTAVKGEGREGKLLNAKLNELRAAFLAAAEEVAAADKSVAALT
jgi:hypothetical protein